MEYFKLFEKEVVTNATLLDIELDNCTDPQDYNDLLDEYRDVITGSKFFRNWDLEESLEEAEAAEEEESADIYEENGKFGLRASSFFSELPPIYDSIEQIDNSNLLKVCYKGKYGMMDGLDDMSVSIPLEYDSIDILTEDELLVIVEKDGKFQYQHKGESEWVDEIILPTYAGWVRARQGSRIGWFDANLRVTYNPQEAHELVIHLSEDTRYYGDMREVDRDMLDRWTAWEEMYRTSPEDLTKAFSSEPDFFSTHYHKNPAHHPYEVDGKMGVKDSLGTIIVPAIYDEIECCNGFVESTCYGRLGNHWGMVVCDSSAVRSPKIELDEPCRWFWSGRIIEKKDGKLGLYDKFNEKYLLDHICDEFIEQKNCNHIIIRMGNKYGFFNPDFNVPPQFDDYRVGRCLSFVRFKKDGKWGYINEAGAWTEHIEEAKAYTVNLDFLYHV